MKILYITERMPYPLDTGGKIRTYHILKGLAKCHEVILVCNYDSVVEEKYRSYLEVLGIDCHFIPRTPETLFGLGIKLLKSLFSRVPIVVSRHYNSILAQKVQSLSAQDIDLVHFDQLDATLYLDEVDGAYRKYLDQHNVVTNQVKTSYLVEKNWLKKLYMGLQLNKTRSYESIICEKMDLCLVCSEADNQYLSDMAPQSKVAVIPNGADVDYFSQSSNLLPTVCEHLKNKETAVFVGTLDYGPGETAVRYFCDEILPVLRTKMKSFSFIAVGQNPPRFLTRLAEKDSRIIVTGRVDDIRQYVACAGVFVVPLLSGSGTRLKILDAMSMRIPVVSTSIGAEGLDAVHGKHILIADNAELFADAVLTVLRSEELSHRLIENGYALVSEQYSWQAVWSLLWPLYPDSLA